MQNLTTIIDKSISCFNNETLRNCLRSSAPFVASIVMGITIASIAYLVKQQITKIQDPSSSKKLLRTTLGIAGTVAVIGISSYSIGIIATVSSISTLAAFIFFNQRNRVAPKPSHPLPPSSNRPIPSLESLVARPFDYVAAIEDKKDHLQGLVTITKSVKTPEELKVLNNRIGLCDIYTPRWTAGGPTIGSRSNSARPSNLISISPNAGKYPANIVQLGDLQATIAEVYQFHVNSHPSPTMISDFYKVMFQHPECASGKPIFLATCSEYKENSNLLGCHRLRPRLDEGDRIIDCIAISQAIDLKIFIITEKRPNEADKIIIDIRMGESTSFETARFVYSLYSSLAPESSFPFSTYGASTSGKYKVNQNESEILLWLFIMKMIDQKIRQLPPCVFQASDIFGSDFDYIGLLLNFAIEIESQSTDGAAIYPLLNCFLLDLIDRWSDLDHEYRAIDSTDRARQMSFIERHKDTLNQKIEPKFQELIHSIQNAHAKKFNPELLSSIREKINLPL